jgi:adenosylmethionine-8-amino-7-oxononanoate aminotransferase
MKVAIQYWHNLGKKKTKFVAFSGGYHGDTFGAMSVGKTTGFYKPFEDILHKNSFIPFPEDWLGNNQLEESERLAMNAAYKIVEKEKDKIAAVILEPLVQGAGGMKICRKEFLDKLVKMFKDQGILVIFDEVMTGFGRTGKMFALDHLSEKPDIICLAKSLTGGYIPLAATIFNEEIHKEFVDSNFKKTFLHGHTFTANPVGCSAALASINLFAKDRTFRNIKKIEDTHKKCLSILSKSSTIKKIRILGSIAAFDLDDDRFKYGSKPVEDLKKKFLNKGLLLRPIGKTIYLMPPFCIKKKVLEDCYKIIEEVIN